MPDGLNDRAADAWEPLVSIADFVGGDWPALAREAALALSGEEVAAAKDENTDTMLLSDIRDAFAGAGAERLSGENLTAYLTGLEGRPWAEWKHGKPLTKFQLARRLKQYRVVSGALDFGGDEGRLKGYRREDFEDAFERYLPSAPVSTRELVIGPEKPKEIRDIQLVTPNSDHELKNAENPSNSARLHEFTSSSQAPASGSGFRSKGATAEGRENAEATPLTPDSEGKPVWTGRAVL